MQNTRRSVANHYAMLGDQFAPKRMAELAPGVIAVEDASGECDALFDSDRWTFNAPEIWEYPVAEESPLLRAAGLKILPGLGRFPEVNTIDEMVLFAKEQLSPKSGELWREVPEFFS